MYIKRASAASVASVFVYRLLGGVHVLSASEHNEQRDRVTAC